MTQERTEILNGWKEIAGYLGRDTRTVERWEKQRGLPVRRVPGAGRATVYAITSELDAWFKGDLLKNPDESTDVAAEQRAALPDPSLNAPQPPLPASIAPVPLVPPQTPEAEQPAQPPRSRNWWLPVAAALCLGIVLWAVTHRDATDAGTHAAALEGAASRPVAGSRLPEVNELVLRGTYAFEQRTPQSLAMAQQYFQHAIALDGSSAAAYAGMANTYLLLREYSAMPDEQAYPLALTAAHKAVSLEPALAQGHTSLGFIDFFWLAQPAAAEHEFKAALSLDARLGLAHHWYGSVLLHEGRYQQAIEELSEAQRLSPNSSAIMSTRALALGLSGHRQEAIKLLQEMQAESPGITAPHQVLALLSLTPPRDMKLYLDEFTAVGLQRHDPAQIRTNEQARAAYARGGEPAVWQLLLAQEERAHPAPAPRTLHMASLEFALGRNDEGFRDVETAMTQHERGLATIQIDPLLTAAVRADPRYRRVLEQIGLLPLLDQDAAGRR